MNERETMVNVEEQIVGPKKRKPRSDKGKTHEKPRPKTTLEAALTGDSVPRGTEAHENKARPDRISIGHRQTKLDAIAAPYVRNGWHPCWVLDDQKGNLEVFQRSWYQFVLDKDGKHVSYPSGPFRLHLMEVEQKYYDDDQRLLAEETSSRMKQKIMLGKDEYAPDERNPAGGGQALTREVVDPTI